MQTVATFRNRIEQREQDDRRAKRTSWRSLAGMASKGESPVERCRSKVRVLPYGNGEIMGCSTENYATLRLGMLKSIQPNQ